MRSSVWKACLAVVSLAVLAGLGWSRADASQAAAVGPASGFKIYSTYVTFYGWYDNTPPGCATAYDGCAGGSGTYADPITFASDKAEFPVGTIIYYPTVQKYFKMEDSCEECTQDWSNPHGGPDGGPGLHHVDLWIGGKGGNEFDVIDCEDALTQGKPDGAPLLTPVEVDPPANQPVSTEPLFNGKTNQCFGGETTSTSYGQYKNGKSGECITDPGNATTAGTPAAVAPCTGAADQDLAFNGAFFVINKLCLNAVSGAGTVGSKLNFMSCGGKPPEQWSINSSGTISTIEYGLCINQPGATVELAKCTKAASEQWVYTSEAAP